MTFYVVFGVIGLTMLAALVGMLVYAIRLCRTRDGILWRVGVAAVALSSLAALILVFLVAAGLTGLISQPSNGLLMPLLYGAAPALVLAAAAALYLLGDWVVFGLFIS